jgi:Zn-dependent peptidase ImmA (M78 family)
VLHEYKHIIDHSGPGIRPSRSAYQRPVAEIVADYFAGCVLIPKRHLAAAYYDGIQNPADLAQLFDVSKEAIQVRLTQIGLAGPLPPDHYRAAPVRAARYYRSAESHLLEVAA